MFIIAAEGEKTEPEYFQMLNSVKAVVHFKCLKNIHGSSPLQILKVMKRYIIDTGLKKTDEAWLVVDKDDWVTNHLQQLFDWSQERDHYNFALSNPKFEYWLLLHFEDGNGIASSQDCTIRLKQYLPNYDKGMPTNVIKPKIQEAINRAKQKDRPPCEDWPKQNGSTVYRLVEKLYSIK